MGSGKIEHGFETFSHDEIMLGIAHAKEKDRVTLDYRRLKAIANNAGKTRSFKKVAPRTAASRALQAYHNEFPGVQFPDAYFQGYVHAVAKMLNSRNPNVRAKREREEAAEELAAVKYGIQRTPDMDPRTQYEITHGLTGHPLEKADA